MTLYFDYQDFTLEEIETYFNTDFEFDADKMKVKVTIHKKEDENDIN